MLVTEPANTIDLYKHQKDAIEKLRSGSLLVGGVGSGKSLTALTYFFKKECFNGFKNLYIITTAKKRDDFDWEKEFKYFPINNVEIVVDSWNNIKKYISVKNSFFIFDEQRVVGAGTWVKSYLKIASFNNWILLSATPGDTWMDYIPVFIANGFYKNRTEFIRRHVVYNNFSKYPKIDHYVEISRLVKFRAQIIVSMDFIRKTISHKRYIALDFDKDQFQKVMIDRWNIYKNKPIKDISELCYTMRKVVNSHPSRLDKINTLLNEHPKIIIFYNFNYELDLLYKLGQELNIPTAQWNGHKHEPIPETNRWLYLVQYAAGSEGWNCIETNVIVFYSQNYSYKATAQAAGRIDRLNTPFTDLYYYYFYSASNIDMAIQKALTNKQSFNDNMFLSL